MTELLKHEHLIVRIEAKNPPKCPEFIKTWMQELITILKMEILMGPYAVYSDMVGNRGLTAITVLSTSHAALHTWDEVDPALIQLDVYSCSEVVVEDILGHIQQFEPVKIEYTFIDREKGLKIIEKTS
jgi:S-adenosylmethionine/arginine decarboxylase-like enzyme